MNSDKTLIPEVVHDLPAIAGPQGELTVTGSVQRVRQYATASEAMARASVAFQVMAGFELIELRTRSPYRRGGDRRSKPSVSALIDKTASVQGVAQNGPDQTPSGSVFEGCHTWEEFCGVACGVSADTARVWMTMAEAVKPRLRKLAGFGALVRDLLSRPISQLTAEETKLLGTAVQKVTDGRTQLDFLAELGLVKQRGNQALGGATAGGGRKATPADPEALRAAAREDFAIVERQLRSIGATFAMLDDTEIEAEIPILEAAIKARREWLRTPQAKRTDRTVDEIAKLLH